jgi:hypothetical protein
MVAKWKLSSTGESVKMRSIRIAALVFLCALCSGAAFAHDEEDAYPSRVATGDKIRIVALEPSGPVRSGVETKFTIEIEAELHSAKEGIARVWFNLKSPTGYRNVERRDLHEGSQRITFETTVTPVDWAAHGQFTMVVNMGPKATDAEWAATAFAQKTILVKR